MAHRELYEVEAGIKKAHFQSQRAKFRMDTGIIHQVILMPLASCKK